MNTLLDAGYPDGALNYWLSSFTQRLPDELIDTAIERFATVPSPMTAILLEHFHGAVTRIARTATAVPHRAPGWNLLIPCSLDRPRPHRRQHPLDPRNVRRPAAPLREPPVAELPRRRPGRRRHPGSYGPNYDRLREIKRRYDPDNVFHLNHNITP